MSDPGPKGPERVRWWWLLRELRVAVVPTILAVILANLAVWAVFGFKNLVFPDARPLAQWLAEPVTFILIVGLAGVAGALAAAVFSMARTQLERAYRREWERRVVAASRANPLPKRKTEGIPQTL